jgi:cytochrome c oxidase assembly factor CtaG
VLAAAAHAGLSAHGGGSEDVAPFTVGRLFTTWEVAWLPIVGVVLLAGIYLYGVSRMRRRGDRWPVNRTIFFVPLGLGSFLLMTTSGLAVYDGTLFWVHMVQHMVLAMVTPVFLALGAPITLALRTLPRTGRRRLVAVLHSRVAKLLTFPVVSGFLFIATPFALYLTGWYEATLRNPLLHELNHIHFVVVGCLWFWPIIGLDPMPNRIPYPLRLLAVFVTMPFHAFLGVAILSQSTVIAGDYYLSLHRSWGPTPLQDQHMAGSVLWATGDIVALVVLAALFVQWARDSEREAAREDRRLDRLEAEDALEARRVLDAEDAEDAAAAGDRAVDREVGPAAEPAGGTPGSGR